MNAKRRECRSSFGQERHVSGHFRLRPAACDFALAAGHDLPTLRFAGVCRRTEGCRRLLPDQHPVQLPEIAVIEQPADHVRRDLACTLRVKPLIASAIPVMRPGLRLVEIVGLH
jgi:hypothetical protein